MNAESRSQARTWPPQEHHAGGANQTTAKLPLKQQVCQLFAAVFTHRRQFRQEWKRWSYPTFVPHGIEGCWPGAWKSLAHSHTGQLRCVLAPWDSTHYRAHFYATYWKWLSAAYAVELTAQVLELEAITLKCIVHITKLKQCIMHRLAEARERCPVFHAK